MTKASDAHANAKPATADVPAPPAVRKRTRSRLPGEEVAPAHDSQAEPPAPSLPKGKLGALVGLLLQPDGVTIEAISAATGWQAHSVRGAISGTVKKKLGFTVASEKSPSGRIYRIVKGAGA